MPLIIPKIRLFIYLCLIIACLCLFFYANTLHNPFIWDDEGLITKNPLIRDWRFWYKVFTSDLYFKTLAGSNFYRPIQTLSYIWDYHFWQLKPFGYHLTNILLQTLTSFLVFLFIFAILKNVIVSFTSALLFAVSPVHTEVVSYISGRADLLMALFLLSSLLLFMKAENYRGANKVIYTFFSLFLFILGLLSKELAAIFPLVILALVFYWSRDSFKKPWYFTTVIFPFFIIDLLYVMLRFTILKFATLWPPELTRYPLFLRITVLPKVFFTYLKLLLLPVNLHMSRALVRPLSFAGIFLSWAWLGIIIFTCIYIYKRNKKVISFLLFWFLIFLLPQSGLFPINAFVAEHFIYLASISFFTAISYLLYRHLRKGPFIISIIGLVFFYGILTLSRNFEWGQPVIFYERLTRLSPESFLAHNNLGVQYEFSKEYEKAIGEFKRALEIKPNRLEAHSNLASVYYKMGRFQDAEQEYKIVEKIAPCNKAGEVQNNIAALYEAEGLKDEALNRYKLALRLDPKLNFTHFNIARIYLAQGQLKKASEEIMQSLPETNPGHYKDKVYLEIIEGHLKSVKNLNCPATLYNDLGVKFAGAGFFDAAIYAFIRVLELTPEYADAHFNLGLAYWKKDFKKKAILEFKLALKINPRHYRARALLAEIGRKK